MINRGEYKHWVEIWEEKETGKTNELGEEIIEPQKVAEFFAKIESRIGGLLTGRPADTVMTTVTHKISYPFGNFSVILPEKYTIRYRGNVFRVNYSLNEGFKDIEMQVFVSEKV